MPRVLIWKERCSRPWQANTSIFREHGWPLTEDRTIEIQRASPGSGSLLGWSGSWDTLAGERQRRGSQTHLTVPSPQSGASVLTLWRAYIHPDTHTVLQLFPLILIGNQPPPPLSPTLPGECSNSPILQMKKQTWVVKAKQATEPGSEFTLGLLASSVRHLRKTVRKSYKINRQWEKKQNWTYLKPKQS